MRVPEPQIISRAQIDAVLPGLDLLSAIERSFVDYSAGRAVVPPVGELLMEKGELHIKYGLLKGAPYYVVKVAAGFYGNSALGLPSSSGLMLVCSQETGVLVGVLLDQGHLTDLRTAVAGAVVARHLAPKRLERIGVLGTGMQARLQLEQLSGVVDCREVLAWGRGSEQLSRYRAVVEEMGYRVETTQDARQLLRTCNLVVTSTPSEEPLLCAEDLRAGTHITAVGSDTPDKQELDSDIFQRADCVVADSIAQCLLRGEIHQAIKAEKLRAEELVELGDVIVGKSPGRTDDSQITVADLTGVAVQDMAIATAVYERARTQDTSE
jgi:ornithine cyclodeaminase